MCSRAPPTSSMEPGPRGARNPVKLGPLSLNRSIHCTRITSPEPTGMVCSRGKFQRRAIEKACSASSPFYSPLNQGTEADPLELWEGTQASCHLPPTSSSPPSAHVLGPCHCDLDCVASGGPGYGLPWCGLDPCAVGSRRQEPPGSSLLLWLP